jgi:hypothetical protein
MGDFPRSTLGVVEVEQVGWVDEYGDLWSLALRNGAVPTDRPVYAVVPTKNGGSGEATCPG